MIVLMLLIGMILLVGIVGYCVVSVIERVSGYMYYKR